MKKNATYYVTQPIRHDGQDYQPGDAITLAEAALAALQAVGAVSDAAPEDVTPAADNATA